LIVMSDAATRGSGDGAGVPASGAAGGPATGVSTLDLIARARLGDRGAREALARRYLGALRRFAHGRVPAAARSLLETDDLVQVAIARTLERIDAFEPERQGSLLAYLRVAVLNHVRDEARRLQRRPESVALGDELAAADGDPLEETIRAEEIARYEAALRRLPGDEQEAFLLRIEMGCGYREIAGSVGRPSANAARLLVRRAVARLARELRDGSGA
jgi:RNA polymerase sigma-70 factor (ECF subfamily)